MALRPLIERDLDRVDEKPWLEHATVLLKMLTAPTPEEFDKRAKGFRRAYERFRDHLMKNRQDPERNSGQTFRDPALLNVLLQLNGAALAWKGYDRVADPEGFERRAAKVSKVHDLMMKTVWTPR